MQKMQKINIIMNWQESLSDGNYMADQATKPNFYLTFLHPSLTLCHWKLVQYVWRNIPSPQPDTRGVFLIHRCGIYRHSAGQLGLEQQPLLLINICKTDWPRLVNNIKYQESKAQASLATNHAIMHQLPEPIRLHDLQNSACSCTEKKIKQLLISQNRE